MNLIRRYILRISVFCITGAGIQLSAWAFIFSFWIAIPGLTWNQSSINGWNLIFDVSSRHKSDEKNLKHILLPLFERYKVLAVFSGHSHNYQRFEYNGIYFTVTGGGGSSLHSLFRAGPYLQKFIMAYHFCLLTAGDGFLNVRVIGIDSNIIDDFKIPVRVGKYAVH